MALGTAQTFLRVRLSLGGLLIVHLFLRFISSQPNAFVDLFLYNSIAFLAAAVAYYSPTFNDNLARIALAGGIFLWAIGSTETTYNSFYSFQIWGHLSDLCYVAFYPLVLFGLIRALTSQMRFRAVEVLDVTIITCGFSCLIATLFLESAMRRFSGTQTSVFLSILYPVGDVVLLALSIILVLVQPRAIRSLLFIMAIAIFATTDLYFLYKSATSGYAFAQLSDDGWLIGLALMAEALWHHGGEVQVSEKIVGIATSIAMIFSGAVLTYSALKVNALPKSALIAAIITISLSVVRLAIALQEARGAATNLELSRRDELTGLANRRYFINELEALGTTPATVLLLDLNGFKPVNDSLGHEAGDTLLRHISMRFSRVIPHGSTLARLGGDEFGVLIPGSPSQGLEVALALSSTLTYPFTINGHEVNAGVSIGRVTNDGSGELMQRADAAMYEAKRAGGGTVLWQP